MMSSARSILYAEDNEEDRFFFLEGVQCINKNIRIITAENGHEVIHHLRKFSPGDELPMAIVSDLRMPLCDGLDMLRIIKQETCWKCIAVILFSTSSSQPEISATRLGVTVFHTKLKTRRDLMEALKTS